MPVMTGLSGNEMYCLNLKGLSPGELVVGNSVYSLGFVGGAAFTWTAATYSKDDGNNDEYKASLSPAP